MSLYALIFPALTSESFYVRYQTIMIESRNIYRYGNKPSWNIRPENFLNILLKNVAPYTPSNTSLLPHERITTINVE